MLYGMYLSANGLALNQYRQDVIANNLANVDTVGYKRDLPVFQERLQEAQVSLSERRFLPGNLTDATGGAFAASSRTDYSTGPLKMTHRSLDVALEGEGFLTVQDGETRAYTRDGRLTVSNGTLVRVSDGKAVLDVDGQPIETGIIPSENLRVDSTGIVWNNGEQVGQLAVVEFDNTEMLSKKGGNLFVAEVEPQPATRTTVIGGALEQSGINAAEQLVAMLKNSRSFELNAEMVSLQNNTLARLVSELPRI